MFFTSVELKDIYKLYYYPCWKNFGEIYTIDKVKYKYIYGPKFYYGRLENGIILELNTTGSN